MYCCTRSIQEKSFWKNFCKLLFGLSTCTVTGNNHFRIYFLHLFDGPLYPAFTYIATEMESSHDTVYFIDTGYTFSIPKRIYNPRMTTPSNNYEALIFNIQNNALIIHDVVFKNLPPFLIIRPRVRPFQSH